MNRTQTSIETVPMYPLSNLLAAVRQTRSRAKVIVLNFILVFVTSTVMADDILRPQKLVDLGPPGSVTAEVVERVEGVENAFLNFNVLRRDFPAIASWSDNEIAKLMNWNLSYIGADQKTLVGIRNSQIPINPAVRSVAYRPETWIRSAILPILLYDGTLIGYVDVKGFGHGARSADNLKNQLDAWQNAPNSREELKNKDHSDGLMSLGEAIAEASRQTASQKLFDYRGASLETVETYAILRLPFNILRKGGEMPAALYVRSMNEGMLYGLRPSELPVPPSIYEDKAGRRQRTRSFSAVDFGGVMITDPILRQNFVGTASDPQLSNAWRWAHETAEAFIRDDNPDKDAIRRHIEEMIAPLTSQPDFAQKSQIAENRRQMLRAEVHKLREAGQTYSEINEQLFPIEAVLKNLMSFEDESEKERAFRSLLDSLSFRGFNKMLMAANRLGISSRIEFYIQNKRWFFLAAQKNILPASLTSKLEYDDYFIRKAIGQGLAENPSAEKFLQRGFFENLNKVTLEHFAANYAKRSKNPSLAVHNFLISLPDVYKSQYLESLVTTANNFPWAWKQKALEALNKKPAQYVRGLIQSSSTPQQVAESLIKNEDPRIRHEAIKTLITKATTDRAVIAAYLNDESEALRSLAKRSLALKDGQDGNFLARVKGIQVKNSTRAGPISCEMVFSTK